METHLRGSIITCQIFLSAANIICSRLYSINTNMELEYKQEDISMSMNRLAEIAYAILSQIHFNYYFDFI